jgi:hypothetical protein
MALRKSRGSRKNKKTSRVQRRGRRSRVSRSNKKTSRVQRRGKRSRTKRGGARRAGGGRGSKQERPVYLPGDRIMTPRSGAEAVAADARAARIVTETAALEAKVIEDRKVTRAARQQSYDTWIGVYGTQTRNAARYEKSGDSEKQAKAEKDAADALGRATVLEALLNED